MEIKSNKLYKALGSHRGSRDWSNFIKLNRTPFFNDDRFTKYFVRKASTAIRVFGSGEKVAEWALHFISDGNKEG